MIKKYSAVLGQEITIDRKHRRVVTSDGVSYSAAEMALIKEQSPEAIRCIHLVKKIFRGKIVQNDRRVLWR